MKSKAKKEWYKRWWLWLVVIALSLALIFAPLIFWNDIVNICDRYFQKAIGISEIYGLYGGVLSFIGSTVLGIIALIQNDKIRRFSYKVFEIEHKYDKLPIFKLISINICINSFFPEKYNSAKFVEENGKWKIKILTHDEDDPESEIYFNLLLKNIGEGAAKNFKASYYDEFDIKEECKFEPLINKEKECAVRFRVPMIAGERVDGQDESYIMSIEYENIYGFKNVQLIRITAKKLENYNAEFIVSMIG